MCKRHPSDTSYFIILFLQCDNATLLCLMTVPLKHPWETDRLLMASFKNTVTTALMEGPGVKLINSEN